MTFSDAHLNSVAPTPIAVVNTSSLDGRHRLFSWVVPASNGEDITGYVVRRLDNTTGLFDFDYNVSCPSPPQPCPDPGTVSNVEYICYPSLSCQPGEYVAIRVGSDLHPHADSYLTPMTAYKWKVIGALAAPASPSPLPPGYHRRHHSAASATIAGPPPGCPRNAKPGRPPPLPDSPLPIAPLLSQPHLRTPAPPAPCPALNKKNEECPAKGGAEGNCDSDDLGGWSPVISAVQGATNAAAVCARRPSPARPACHAPSCILPPCSHEAPHRCPPKLSASLLTAPLLASTLIAAGPASPDRVSALAAGEVTVTSVVLNWGQPVDNGRPVEAYRIGCTDVSSYKLEAWRRPFVTFDVGALTGSASEASPTVVVGELTPGTTYECAIGANNSFGGFEPAYSVDLATVSTLAVDPDQVAPSALTCDYVYNTINGGTGGGGVAPGQEPSATVELSFPIPRPNWIAQNAVGPASYDARGPLGDSNFSASELNEAGDTLTATMPVTVPNARYQYATDYPFQLKAWSPGFYDPSPDAFTDKSCTTPNFRPGPPNITGTLVLDRSISVTWDAAALNCQPGDCEIDQYLYSICKGLTQWFQRRRKGKCGARTRHKFTHSHSQQVRDM